MNRPWSDSPASYTVTMFGWSIAGLEQALAAEALAERVVLAEVGGEELERDGAVEGELRRLVDDAHAALTENALDAVAREGCALL